MKYLKDVSHTSQYHHASIASNNSKLDYKNEHMSANVVRALVALVRLYWLRILYKGCVGAYSSIPLYRGISAICRPTESSKKLIFSFKYLLANFLRCTINGTR